MCVHGGSCMTAENVARRRKYRRNHPHPESPESRRKSNRKYRISSYGLAQEQFERLLAAQQYTCCARQAAHAGAEHSPTPD
jgi:hypothetical protein